VLDCPVLYWQAAAFSAGGDGGGKPPEFRKHFLRANGSFRY
jgi:hypothetical protein